MFVQDYKNNPQITYSFMFFSIYYCCVLYKTKQKQIITFSFFTDNYTIYWSSTNIRFLTLLTIVLV